jgi:hypothetical protein
METIPITEAKARIAEHADVAEDRDRLAGVDPRPGTQLRQGGRG